MASVEYVEGKYLMVPETDERQKIRTRNKTDPKSNVHGGIFHRGPHLETAHSSFNL